MAKVSFQYKRVTASTVIAGAPVGTGGVQNTGGPQGILHTITVTSAAATAVIQAFDDTTTSGPATPICGPITAPAGGYTTPFTIFFDCEVTKGITVMITIAAADVQVSYA